MSDIEALERPALAGHVIFIRYVLFAIVAGLANLAAQEAVVRLLPGAVVMISVLAGTGVGFVVKYLLEKRWVFLDNYDGHAAEIRKIVVYGCFGVGTTLLFWGIELGAWAVWQTPEAKFIGAAIGLSLGNWIKYLLDRHYVFGRTA
jgi:putative flippase GtrA